MNRAFRASGVLITIIAICASGACCRKQSDADGRGRSTEEFLSEQLRRPMNIGGGSNQTDFVQHTYVPGVERARRSMDRLKRGDLDVLPIAAYVRPRESDCLLWMIWLQRDDGARTVILRDKDGIFATFTEPTPGNEYAQNKATYVRLDTVTLNQHASEHIPSVDELPVIQVKRPFDVASVRLSFGASGSDGLPSTDGIDAPLYLLPKSEPTTNPK
jgi:hypothetical protein